jgi:hypothetical protein
MPSREASGDQPYIPRSLSRVAGEIVAGRCKGRSIVREIVYA